MTDKPEADTSPKNSDVSTKYRTAGEFANKALQSAIDSLKVGAKIVDICAATDKVIEDLCAGCYKSGKLLKGIAFPTCVSVNNCMGHNSPLSADTAVLKEGDVAKIDLGVHIDGFIAAAAHTVVVSENPAAEITGKAAAVIAAAHTAAEAALHSLRPGTKNTEVTAVIGKAIEPFNCTAVEHVTSCQMKQFVIAAAKTIAARPPTAGRSGSKVDDCTVEEYDVFAVDIVVSTGLGLGRELETRPTIYKRNVDVSYQLKLKSSRYFLSEVNSRAPTLPFTLRAFDENKARLGLTECLQHNLLEPYPVIYEKPEEIVAQFKYTAMVLPSGIVKIAGLAAPQPTVKAEAQPTDEIKALIATPLRLKEKEDKKKKPKAENEAAASSSSSSSSTAPAAESNNNSDPAKEDNGRTSTSSKTSNETASSSASSGSASSAASTASSSATSESTGTTASGSSTSDQSPKKKKEKK